MVSGNTRPVWWRGTAPATTTTPASSWTKISTGPRSFWIFFTDSSRWLGTNLILVSWTCTGTGTTCAAGTRTCTRSSGVTRPWLQSRSVRFEFLSFERKTGRQILSGFRSFPDRCSWWRVLFRYLLLWHFLWFFIVLCLALHSCYSTVKYKVFYWITSKLLNQPQSKMG